MAAKSIRASRWPDQLRACAGATLCLVWAASFTLRGGAAGEMDLHGIARIAGRAAPNVVVWLDAPDAPRPAQTRKIVLDQRSLQFSPQVLAVRVGTTVVFPNNDRVFHNVFSFHHGTVFDLGLYPVGTSKVVRFDKPGVSRIFCNIHPNMAAYVFVVDTPYFGVSDGSGAFALSAVPPDRYTYHAWRPGAPELSGVWSPSGSAIQDGGLLVEWPK